MKTILSSTALTLALAIPQISQAALHAETTSYDSLQTKLVLQPGQTYLAFMKNQVKPALDAFEDAINQESQAKPNQYSQWQTDLINQGAGVAIRIDANNYFFNVGYLDGSQSNDIKSGRSYGVGPSGRESDPSDAFYLKELQDYLKSEPDHVGDFSRAIMLVLTNCDSSGWANLSQAGQIVATDFMAIYTAESDRHLMVNLRPQSHPWEIDLAAATFVSVFNAQTGLMPQQQGSDLSFTSGDISAWWAKGQQGSGIGETRNVRLSLTSKIGQFEQTQHPEIASPIEDVIGRSSNADMIQGTFAYLNSPSAADQIDSAKLTNAFTAYIQQVQSDAGAIAGGN